MPPNTRNPLLIHRFTPLVLYTFIKFTKLIRWKEAALKRYGDLKGLSDGEDEIVVEKPRKFSEITDEPILDEFVFDQDAFDQKVQEGVAVALETAEEFKDVNELTSKLKEIFDYQNEFLKNAGELKFLIGDETAENEQFFFLNDKVN